MRSQLAHVVDLQQYLEQSTASIELINGIMVASMTVQQHLLCQTCFLYQALHVVAAKSVQAEHCFRLQRDADWSNHQHQLDQRRRTTVEGTP